MAATAPVQVLEASANSLAFTPVMVTPVIFRVALPLFVTVTTTGRGAAPKTVSDAARSTDPALGGLVPAASLLVTD